MTTTIDTLGDDITGISEASLRIGVDPEVGAVVLRLRG